MAQRFILASQSPRRRGLLEQAGYVFDVIPSDVDESQIASADLAPEAYAMHLALAKAADVAKRFPGVLVLGADTIVDCDGRIIGKPVDVLDAERILRVLFSRPHRVITGLALVCRSQALEIVAHDTTTLYPRPLTDSQIQQLLQSGSWQGKAGAYAVQEQGDLFVERMEGSLTNVVGLPMERLCPLLNQALQVPSRKP